MSVNNDASSNDFDDNQIDTSRSVDRNVLSMEQGHIDPGEIFQSSEDYGSSEGFQSDNDVHNEEEKAEDIDPQLNLLFEEATVLTSWN